jgi:hypothetical protein
MTNLDIMNPIEYAGGRDPLTKCLGSTINGVFRKGDVVIILFRRPKACVRESVDYVFKVMKCLKVVVLSSTPKSNFIGDVSIPSIFFLSNKAHNGRQLPTPNKVEGIAGGFLTIGGIEGRDVTVCEVVEEEAGATVESMRLLTEVVATVLSLEDGVEAVAQHAHFTAKNRFGNRSRFG